MGVFLFCLALHTAGFAWSQCDIHSWHQIYAREGNWHVTLKVINQHGFFVDQACQPMETGIANNTAPLSYGFGFASSANFDIAYTVTAVKEDKQGFQSPACVFIVSATGPAQPEIAILGYHGAECEWKSNPGTGASLYLATNG